jgi:hypothetical protein
MLRCAALCGALRVCLQGVSVRGRVQGSRGRQEGRGVRRAGVHTRRQQGSEEEVRGTRGLSKGELCEESLYGL